MKQHLPSACSKIYVRVVLPLPRPKHTRFLFVLNVIFALRRPRKDTTPFQIQSFIQAVIKTTDLRKFCVLIYFPI